MTARTSLKRAPARKNARNRAKPRRTVPNQPSALSQFLARIPVKSETIERAVTFTVAFGVVAALAGLAVVSGVPGYIGTEMAQAAGRAGFAVKRVEVTGLDRMERLTVYAIALDQQSMAMPLVDLEKIRSQLMQYGWVQDARVSRRLPDTLVVDIVERKPAAIWQNNHKLSLVDDQGVVLERVNPSAMPDLPLLIGKDANHESRTLATLMEQAPALKPVLASATWVGNRRWDLRFQSGETLALPEGDEAAGKALVRFARIDGVERLLGRGLARFDMRDPSRLVVRRGEKRAAIDQADDADTATNAIVAPISGEQG